jgi:sulfatase maturation enzyme AslB (radical SAM superfamily)
LDGFEKMHDMIRGTPKSFARAEKTFKLLSKLGEKHKNFHLEREVTVSKYNISELPLLFKYLGEKNIPFTITFARGSEYYENKNDNVSLSEIPEQRIVGLLDPISNSRLVGKEEIVRNVFIKLARKYFVNPRKQIIPCYSGFSSLFVDPYGNVYPCIMFFERLGNLRKVDFDLKKILSDGGTKRVRMIIKENGCPSCWTPCEAYTTIIQNPLRSFSNFINF